MVYSSVKPMNMFRQIRLFLFVFICFQAGPLKAQWNPDNGDSTYTNPVIFADYSDPDVVRVGNDYYMVASSFNCMPGIPVMHSYDLVNWEIIGHVYERLPFDKYNKQPTEKEVGLRLFVITKEDFMSISVLPMKGYLCLPPMIRQVPGIR